jgi:two-component system chemotaxis response regulator CheB
MQGSGFAWRRGSAVRLAAQAPTSEGKFRLVVMAASAGGVKAFESLLAQLPEDFPLPVAIVQHRTTRDPNLMTRVLSRHTVLPVKTAEAGEQLRPGTVYLAPPDAHLIVDADLRVALADGHRIRHVLSSANPLFESAARVFPGRVIAVVLTGYDRDGTDGVQAVKLSGGSVIAQDRGSSQVFEMPRSAIQTGCVDRVLPLEAIGPALVALAKTPS